MSQITTATFFNVDGFANKWWAFKQMQLGLQALKGVQGLSFYKILGSGDGNGFGILPNFGTYVLFCVWEKESDAHLFFAHNDFYQSYRSRSSEQLTVYLRSAKAHGLWDGVQPFAFTTDLALDKPVLVLTRARIHLAKLWSFWRRVGNVSQSLDDYKGVILSIGVGEWPLIQQATLSIWHTQAEMLDYAYKNEAHKKVVMQSRQLKWYKEEMFARFVPYKFEGTWGGKHFESALNS
jgi:hypothetical protein